jgi:hypothetical protein
MSGDIVLSGFMTVRIAITVRIRIAWYDQQRVTNHARIRVAWPLGAATLLSFVAVCCVRTHRRPI